MADNKWGPFLEWLWQEYTGSVHLDSVEGGRGFKRFLAGLDPNYQAGGRLRQHYFMHLKYGWPIAPSGYTYCRFDMKLGTQFTYAYTLVNPDGSPAYVCVSPTYDSRDGEYRSRMITYADFEWAYESASGGLSKIEAKILELISRGKVELKASFFPPDQLSSAVEEQRLPLKCAAVAFMLDISGWAQIHVLTKYQQGLEEVVQVDPELHQLCASVSGSDLEAVYVFSYGHPPSDTRKAADRSSCPCPFALLCLLGM